MRLPPRSASRPCQPEPACQPGTARRWRRRGAAVRARRGASPCRAALRSGSSRAGCVHRGPGCRPRRSRCVGVRRRTSAALLRWRTRPVRRGTPANARLTLLWGHGPKAPASRQARAASTPSGRAGTAAVRPHMPRGTATCGIGSSRRKSSARKQIHLRRAHAGPCIRSSGARVTEPSRSWRR